MSAYEKSAVFVLRLFFGLMILFGLGGIPVSIMKVLYPESDPARTIAAQIESTSFYLVAGTIGLLMARKLGRLVARGL